MIFLGIDPGTTTTGYGIIEERNNKFKVIDFGCITTKKYSASYLKLEEIYEQLRAIIAKFKPQAAAIEKIFFCKNVKTALNVEQARGLILFLLAKSNLTIFELTPLEVKKTITGYGHASKKQIQKMIKILLNLKMIPKPDDAADALALSISCAMHYRANDKIHKTFKDK